MKRDIQINIDHLDAMTKKIATYLGNVATMKIAAQKFVDVLQEQESQSLKNLAAEWQSMIVDSAELLQYRLTEAYRILERYISETGHYIGPKDSSKMMRVDRNDIYYNLKQIEGHLWDLIKS